MPWRRLLTASLQRWNRAVMIPTGEGPQGAGALPVGGALPHPQVAACHRACEVLGSLPGLLVQVGSRA
jgi:hypothetical protein